ncbi:hypothetical protein IAU60_002294 [Kwoniella sp. DSM 27419]
MTSSSASPVTQIRSITQPPVSQADQVRAHIDSHFSDLDALLRAPHVSGSAHAGPSRRRKRGLDEEIAYWVEKENRAAKELEETGRTLPGQLEDTQERLQTLLASAQELSLQRYKIADQLAGIVTDLSSNGEAIPDGQAEDTQKGDDAETGQKAKELSVVGQLENLQDELGRLEAGLAWVQMLEEVVRLSETTLSPSSHKPSPLAALPHYRRLCELVDRLEGVLQPGMAIMGIVREVKERTWQGMKDILSENLLKACEPLGWPKKVVYEDVSPEARRTFETAFLDLLFLQAEGEDLHGEETAKGWSSGAGLYAIQAMVKPIELRFKYHFQGKKGTNRVDKPEWAFANILDQIYEHQSFLSNYLQPLCVKGGYDQVSVKSEFTLLLFPIVLSLLRSRIPHLLDHPALLAHTIYQTIVFDEAIKDGGFELETTSLYEGRECGEWEGLSGVILREEDWFTRWLVGEKKFAEGQLNEIISSSDAWTITDEAQEDDAGQSTGLRPTVSARQVKALIEQITDRYAPLPDLVYKLPFLLAVQFPQLVTYHSRVSGSLDAFENLSSVFVRAVPGALAGNTRSGIHIDQAKLTTGKNGLERLIKAWLSGRWVAEAMRKWADDLFFVELAAGFSSSVTTKWKYVSDPLVPASIKSATPGDLTVVSHASVFEVLLQRYDTLGSRAEDMIVRIVTAEVESDLKLHLTRRWDAAPFAEAAEPTAHLLSAMTTYTSHMTTIKSTLPPVVVSKLYRRIVGHLSNHILQRGVYAGWSKFSERGGKDLVDEIREWKEVSSGVIGDVVLHGTPIPYEAPWKGLEDVGKVISLPSGAGEAGDGQVSFAQAMASAWDGEEGLKVLNDRLGIDMSRQELQSVLRRRGECWR